MNRSTEGKAKEANKSQGHYQFLPESGAFCHDSREKKQFLLNKNVST